MYRTRRRPFIVILTILTIVSIVGLIVTPAGAVVGPNPPGSTASGVEPDLGYEITLVRPPTYALADAEVYEGGLRGLTFLTFDITASEALDHDVTFLALTQPGSASAADDYVSLSYTPVVLKAGETSAEVRVQILGDTVVEDDETLNLQLYRLDATNTWHLYQATGTILDDDVRRAASLRR